MEQVLMTLMNAFVLHWSKLMVWVTVDLLVSMKYRISTVPPPGWLTNVLFPIQPISGLALIYHEPLDSEMERSSTCFDARLLTVDIGSRLFPRRGQTQRQQLCNHYDVAYNMYKSLLRREKPMLLAL